MRSSPRAGQSNLCLYPSGIELAGRVVDWSGYLHILVHRHHEGPSSMIEALFWYSGTGLAGVGYTGLATRLQWLGAEP